MWRAVQLPLALLLHACTDHDILSKSSNCLPWDVLMVVEVVRCVCYFMDQFKSCSPRILRENYTTLHLEAGCTDAATIEENAAIVEAVENTVANDAVGCIGVAAVHVASIAAVKC